MKFRFLSVAILSLAIVGIGFGTTGCSLLKPNDTPSSQVLSEIREAETAFNVAQTILIIKAIDDGKDIDPDVKLAEDAVYAILKAAKDAASKGDTVTMNQKLDLFNEALKNFSDKYVADHAATQPAK